MEAVQISLSGMDVEWRRLEIIAENLANMNTTRTALGDTYRERELISGPRAGFDDYLSAARAGGEGRVMVYGVEESSASPRLVHDPHHPHADEHGMVSYPNVDHAGQMTAMIRTARAYEANIVAINAARQMYRSALDLGRRG